MILFVLFFLSWFWLGFSLVFFDKKDGNYSYSNFTSRIRVISEKINAKYLHLFFNIAQYKAFFPLQSRVFTSKILKEILEKGITKSGGDYKFRIPLCEPVEYPEVEVKIPPYILGLMLGDGYMIGSTPSLSFNAEIANPRKVSQSSSLITTS